MIITATAPLVAEFGPAVTTKQIAQAAGVAEGTIFRVFPDKETLVQCVVERVLDPDPLLAELRAVDAALPLPERLTAIVAAVQRRFTMVFNLMIAIGMKGPPTGNDGRPHVTPQHTAVLDEVQRLLEPDTAEFRLPLGEVVRMIRLLTFAGSHPLITDNHLLSPEEISSVLLDGTRHHTAHGEKTC
jgi:AcrR family transcriptional regulator